MTIDEQKVEAFAERIIADLAATAHAATVVVGDRLGLYRALAEGGRQTPAQLAGRTGCNARLVEEWLNAQAASEYCSYDAATGTYWLEPEQEACLVDESGPAFVLPYVTLASTLHKDEERGAKAFTGEASVAWGDHHHDLYTAVARLTPSDYAGLVRDWIPALDGVEDQLRAGARVADIGCGEGLPTVMLAEAFPASTFAGFDFHPESIAKARKAAADAGVADRVTFEVAVADETPGEGYDLVCTFDAFHDMGDPVAVAREVRRILAPGGTWIIVDRNAADTVEGNFNTVGRFSYSASTFVCVPNALAHGGSFALGAQAGEARLREVILAGGFAQVRRAAESPFNLVLEARLSLSRSLM
ncbi:MAG: class I SAM-dependent methyltransferase [Acidimicrobiales bacterium]